MSSMKRAGTIALALLVPVLLLSAADEPKKEHADMAKVSKATCVIHGLGNSKVHGKITFTQHGHDVEIAGKISGLTPGKHGFHVHEFGDCSSKDGLSAGGHFNPGKKDHGGPESHDRHVGDLGNIEANDDGVATIKITDKMVALNGAHSIIGRSIIVHAKEDDLKDIKSAGARIAGGVIGIGKP